MQTDKAEWMGHNPPETTSLASKWKQIPLTLSASKQVPQQQQTP